MKSNLIHALQNVSAWPGQPREVRLVETHISWVFLAGDFAWKIKKPVRFDFLDFSTLNLRKRFCDIEIALNRRAAPDLYLGVVPICGTPTNPEVGGDGDPIEYAVKMRRFEQDQLYLSLAKNGELESGDAELLADAVAKFHLSIPEVDRESKWGTECEIRSATDGNFSVLRDCIDLNLDDGTCVERLAIWTQDELRKLQPFFLNRKNDGFVKECHGDLHLRNIVRFEGKPCLFDCIEFNESFRCIDVVSDLAFLVSDLADHGFGALGWRLLNRWLEHTGDYAGMAGLWFYLVYRALVRVKVDTLRLKDSDLDPPSRKQIIEERHAMLEYAGSVQCSAEPKLIIMHGLSGSGKTTVASQLIESIGAIRIRSDVERKRLTGILAAPGEVQKKAPPEFYAKKFTGSTYDRLVAVASDLLAAGHSVIVDATFLKREYRERFQELAEEAEAPFFIVSCGAPRRVLEERLFQRARRGDDASDAGVDELRLQIETGEPLTGIEREHAFFPVSNDSLESAAKWGETLAGKRSAGSEEVE
ncbi:MAG: aminoglycoside phosphotransferase family enzyme/predicted kinase [Verrucomicrobiales bacterium]|jgi:aminoglycoside phosphotransferase family enzyme/predicted kinase